ncbi:MAG TPA: OmpH family outer membrane protein [Candidatus Acidoferrales bacterium]
MKIRAILPFMALAAFSFAPAAMAQAGAPPTKFKVMDMRTAIIATAEAKADVAQLQSQFAPQQAQLESLNKQIDDLARKLQAGTNTLSDEEKARLTRQGQMLQSQYKRASDQLEEQSNAAQQDMVDGIGRKMMDIVDNYRKENGLDCVLNTSSDSIGILSKSVELDITQEIIKLYDQKYPVKAATTAAPKPATPPASPAVKKPGGEK